MKFWKSAFISSHCTDFPCSLRPVTWSLCDLGLCYSQVRIAIFFHCASLEIAGGEEWRDQQVFQDSTTQHKLFPVCSKHPLSELAVPSGDILIIRCLLLTCLKWVPPVYTHWQKGSPWKLSPNLHPAKVKLLSSNHLFKLALVILSSSNFQWLCLSLAFLLHCELETTTSISVLLSFPNIILNFSYLPPNPPCLQTSPHTNTYTFSLPYSPAISVQQHSKPENTLVRQPSNIHLTSPLLSKEFLGTNSHETLLGRKGGKTLTTNSFSEVFSVCSQGMTSPCLKVAPHTLSEKSDLFSTIIC